MYFQTRESKIHLLDKKKNVCSLAPLLFFNKTKEKVTRRTLSQWAHSVLWPILSKEEFLPWIVYHTLRHKKIEKKIALLLHASVRFARSLNAIKSGVRKVRLGLKALARISDYSSAVRSVWPCCLLRAPASVQEVPRWRTRLYQIGDVGESIQVHY